MTETLAAKRPAEVLDYAIDASGLLGSGETLVAADSSITVIGATKDSQSFTDTGATVWISGGTAGELITVTAVLVTSGGRTFQRVYVIPYGEPVTLEQAKAHLRVLDDSEDMLIAGYVRAARQWVENYTGHILVRRTITEYRHCFSSFFELQWRPVVSTGATITYTDTAGTAQPYTTFFITERLPARVYPNHDAWWPSLGRNGEVKITYTAGYAETEVPQALIQAVLLLVGHWFANRETVIDRPSHEVPFAVASLCDQYRSPVL